MTFINSENHNYHLPCIHHVLAESVLASSEEQDKQVIQNFKLKKSHKELIDAICYKNGTTPSKFYQKCAEVLIRDYVINGQTSEAQDI